MSPSEFRQRILRRFAEDLVGPLNDEEVLTDRPTQRYSTGVLYPQDSLMLAEEDQDGGPAVNVEEETPGLSDLAGVSLSSTMKPSTAGLSFAVAPDGTGRPVTVKAVISCATYSQAAVDETEGEPSPGSNNKAKERWQRVPHAASKRITLSSGEIRVDLADSDLAGLELYILVAPVGDLITVTAALSNGKRRGDSSAFDEAQHFFQVRLTLQEIENGAFAPRPSRRALTDEESRSAALIYRNAKQYVVGHTCAAKPELDDTGLVKLVMTEWIPSVEVPGTSEHGDDEFERLRNLPRLKPLMASWLSHATLDDLVDGLSRLVQAYQDWIAAQTVRAEGLPSELKPQADKNLQVCRRGADRMHEGIQILHDDDDVRRAFQLSQDAMQLQFGWQKDGAELSWRPFQLAFQLLALPSLADLTHTDREVMDLLWFPTGGGKTEAYLSLAGFVIFLRRLRIGVADEGAGVAVLMRYTLRLLTVQQFQRAAALVCASELLRRKEQQRLGSNSRLGSIPIGLGLWVGAASTPLTLREAVLRTPEDPSDPRQLTACPCCGAELRWSISLAKSKVECPNEMSRCEFAASGKTVPVWTIDEEVYRHAPSLVIGTIDKFAQIVRKPETQALFGMGRKYGPPELIVQDELHLISGPLGSIAGLYETAIDALCSRAGTRPKIVGSTATIRRATDQARALFDRSTYQFPPPGIDADNSGFAVANHKDPGRLYVGVTTAGRSATYMLQAIAASLLQAAGVCAPIEGERDNYWTLVIYFNSIRELGRALVLVQDDVPVSVAQVAARRNEKSRKLDSPAELTSRVPSYEIRDMLARLSRRAGESDAVDLLVASNMISVGMDIPRLGLMIVDAQPKSLAEYIQATSRVGRGSVPGLVVTMYNNTRPRDRSHFESFDTWHRSLYRDVEATSVTPFASRAQDKALHAVLVAIVRHMIPEMTNKPVLDDLRRERAEELASFIEERVSKVDPAERVAVRAKLRTLLDEWASRPDLQVYWDDYGNRTSLMMSAEQFAAQAEPGQSDSSGGAPRALWPTPNSMREVEAGSPYIMRRSLRNEEPKQ